MENRRRALPAASTKCGCGHAFHEHVQAGEQHACQHGAQPPFTRMCPCKKFRTKEEELAHAELKRQSRRNRSQTKVESKAKAVSAAVNETKALTPSANDGVPETDSLGSDLVGKKAPELPH